MVNAPLLAQSRGTVRCGRCNRKFDALEQLFDEWPAPEDTPPPAGARYRPPVLGSQQDLFAPFGPAYVHRPSPATRSGWWVALAVLLLLVTTGNLAWTFKNELRTLPLVGSRLAQLGLAPQPSEAAFRDSARIHVISRDLHSHPTLAGVLVLSATFVNVADRAQTWPDLELTLLDLEGRAVASRQFRVDEYLPGRGFDGDLLQPGVHVPVLLEFASPGDAAVGFEIQFPD